MVHRGMPVGRQRPGGNRTGRDADPEGMDGGSAVESGRGPAFNVQNRDGGRRMYAGGSTLHLADRSDDGRIGVARRKRAGGSLELAYRLLKASKGAYRNSLMPSGALSFQRRLTQEQKTALRAQLREQFAGEENTGAILLLDDGAGWTPVTITPRDGDLVAARQQTVPDVCRVGSPAAAGPGLHVQHVYELHPGGPVVRAIHPVGVGSENRGGAVGAAGR